MSNLNSCEPNGLPSLVADPLCGSGGPYWGSHCAPRADHNYCQECTCCQGNATCSKYSELDFGDYAPGGAKTLGGKCGWWLEWWKPWTGCDDGRPRPCQW